MSRVSALERPVPQATDTTRNNRGSSICRPDCTRGVAARVITLTDSAGAEAMQTAQNTILVTVAGRGSVVAWLNRFIVWATR